ncbi:hypothetical protein I4U23_019873 [Adineta vaga]|nr:hypothetical protein I4U23_019873 [Adineta vaga]
MAYHLFSQTIKHTFTSKLSSTITTYIFKRQISSAEIQSLKKQKPRYFKYAAITVGGTITFSFVYQFYKWIVQLPTCPNYNRNQHINLNNPLACTVLLRNMKKSCSGKHPMIKVGAATGINFKLTQSKFESSDSSTKIILNDNNMIERNIFDATYVLDYFETLADLISKLDEIHITNLLSNIIGYYVFICPECHSSMTRQMISCTSYLNQAGLENYPADISEITPDMK